MRCSRLLLVLAFSVSLRAQSNPIPFLNQPLVPAAVAAGSAQFSLTINGSGFVAGATAYWNGLPLATQFVSAIQVTATVPASYVVATGSATVRVTNPAPGGGSSSNSDLFTVTNPTSTLAFNTTTISSVPQAIGVAAADFNGDGKSDLAVVSTAPAPGCNYQFQATGSIAILLSNGDGTFTQKSELCMPDRLGDFPEPTILAADLNGDGAVDLIGLSESTVLGQCSIYYGNGDGTFSGPFVIAGISIQLRLPDPFSAAIDPAKTSSTGFFPIAGVAAGDFGGQGSAGVALSYISGLGSTLIVIFPANDLVAGWSPAQEFLGPLAAGDFNRDGRLDLTMSNSPGISAFLNNGDDTYTQLNAPASTNGQTGVSVGDFNRDGILDIVSSKSVLLGKGDGTFRVRSGSPGAGLVADFNGDGKLDLAVGDSVFLGNGNGTFQAGINAGASALAAGDFNGDGRIDLAGVNDDGTVSLSLQVPIATSTALASSLSPSIYGQPVTFTATMTPHGAGAPTGAITFQDGSSVLATKTLHNGVIGFSTRSLNAGTHALTAEYGGDANYLGSTSNLLEQVVKPAATQCSITAAPVYIKGQLLYRFTATVASTTPAPTLPTGQVTFWDSAYSQIELGTANLSGGKAVLTVALPPAPDPQYVMATYKGAQNFVGCQSPYVTIFQ